jgi:AcrR family transcriptional regulator
MARPPGHGPEFEARRQSIIDSAASLFAERGYSSTGIAEIAAAVDLGKGALYYYIGSKENLLVEIQDRVLRPLLRSGNRITALDEPPLVKLRLLSESLLVLIFERLDHIRVYEHDYRSLQGDNLTRVLEQRAEFEQLVRVLLKECADAGALRQIEPHLAALQFLNLHNHSFTWLRPDGRWGPTDLSREYIRTLVSGWGRDGDLDAAEARLVQFRAEYDGPSLHADFADA